MTFQNSNAVRNAGCDAVTALYNVGAVTAGGLLEFLEADGTTVVCTITLNDPAFDAAVAGDASFNNVPALTPGSCIAGTINRFRTKDRAGTILKTGDAGSVTLAGGGGDIQLTGASLTVTLGTTITLNTLVNTYVAQGG